LCSPGFFLSSSHRLHRCFHFAPQFFAGGKAFQNTLIPDAEVEIRSLDLCPSIRGQFKSFLRFSFGIWF